MKTEKLNEVLKNLNNSSPDVEASAVMSIDGLTIATALSESIDEDRVGAMSAALLSIGNRTSGELNRGTLEQVMVKGEKGYVLIVGAGKEAVLAVVAGSEAKLGLVFLEAKRAAESVAGALE